MCALAVDAIKSTSSQTGNTGTKDKSMPTRAQVVVVGAGVIGCSIAYHLTRMGCRDVLLLERKSIGSGTTWHSHGVVGLTRASPTLLRMAMETTRLLPELERETGHSTGYSVRGSVNVTSDPSRLLQFRRFADIARKHGLPIEIVDGAEAKRLWPHMNEDGIIGAMHLPTEGQCNPLDLTQALAAGARAGGARIIENVAVTGAQYENGRIIAVETEDGPVECETLINSTGLWARDFLRKETGGLALQAMEHNYLVAEFSEKVGQGLPLMRDPDLVMTVREDGGQISVGFNEHEGKLFAENGVPENFEFDELPPDWDAIMPYLEGAANRIPMLNELGIRLFLCGPEAATPDTRYMMGKVPPFQNYFVAAGFSGIGIGSAGGAGAAIAHWVMEGTPREDLWDVDVQRMMPYQSNRNYLIERTPESNGKLFAMNWPHRQNRSARGVRRSPLHEAMAQARACFSEVGGWEVPEWFAPEGVEPIPYYSFEKPAWFPYSKSEAHAALSGLGVSDRSMAGKFLITGPGAKSALAALCANDPAKAQSGPIQTPILNSKGGVEAMFTLLQKANDGFLLIGEPATQVRDMALLEEHLSSVEGVCLVDMTSAFAVLDIIGPRGTETLNAAGWRGVISADGDAFDRAAEIGPVTAVLMRETRYCVPAWTIVVPTEFAAAAYDVLMAAGCDHGIRPVGQHARQALLTMAGTALWAQGLTPDSSPAESGLQALVDLSDERTFTGRDVCARENRHGVSHRLCLVTLDQENAILLGHEPVRIDNQAAGEINQAAYPLVSSCAAGLARLTNGTTFAPGSKFAGRCEVCIANEWIAGTFVDVEGIGKPIGGKSASLYNQ